MQHERMTTQGGITQIVYGWPQTEKRLEPVVHLEFGSNPCWANTTMTPDEARRLACNLLTAADRAEGLTDTFHTFEPFTGDVLVSTLTTRPAPAPAAPAGE